MHQNNQYLQLGDTGRTTGVYTPVRIRAYYADIYPPRLRRLNPESYPSPCLEVSGCNDINYCGRLQIARDKIRYPICCARYNSPHLCFPISWSVPHLRRGIPFTANSRFKCPTSNILCLCQPSLFELLHRSITWKCELVSCQLRGLAGML